MNPPQYPGKSFYNGLTMAAGGGKHEATYFEWYKQHGVVLKRKYRKP